MAIALLKPNTNALQADKVRLTNNYELCKYQDMKFFRVL